MKKLMIATAVALTLAVPQAQAFVFKSSVLSPSVAVGVQTGHVGVLNGSNVGILNNNAVLSGNTNNNLLSGIGILGSGGASNIVSNVVRGRR